MHQLQQPSIPSWPLRSTTVLGKIWTSLPASFRLSVYRLLRAIGERIWPRRPFTGMVGKQRLPFNLFCKFGERVSPSEVLATVFVSENMKIPVPRILDVVYEGKDLFVLMSRLPGVPADEAAVHFDESDWSALETDLGNWIGQLRSLAPNTDVVGSFLQTSNLQRRIEMRRNVGPWANISAFQRYLVTLCPEDEGSDAYREFRRVAPEKIFNKNHRLCFTHGDLALHNLLVENGRLSGLVDFECSGWFPEYWEYTGAVGFKASDRWIKAINSVLGDLYQDELEAEKFFWDANSGNV
ncbi:hypothetical protein CVT26_006885 [Gymnopilus dilepis]|uniref:Aminoglycoside phosphotransferase domain-containing protein n=1 Tax=Gymnopilus dilepis TaxID=231916 RepID=A0A409W0Z1_9AGAR|nr:hypothetical protein CVT26_006885 [Gymnopilus dilepis]